MNRSTAPSRDPARLAATSRPTELIQRSAAYILYTSETHAQQAYYVHGEHGAMAAALPIVAAHTVDVVKAS
jgi:hypothetical protein